MNVVIPEWTGQIFKEICFLMLKSIRGFKVD